MIDFNTVLIIILSGFVIAYIVDKNAEE